MSLSTRLTLVMIALVLLTAGSIGFLTYRNLEQVTRRSELERERTRVTMMAGELNAYVESVRTDVIVARKLAAVDGLVRAWTSGSQIDPETKLGTPNWAQAVALLFRAELSAKPKYLQMRLIGVADDGRELLRLDRSGENGRIRLVPKPELQPKGARDYVREALKLADGAVYVSPIELNRERGRIEEPPTPVLRAATPIFRKNGKPFGVLVINVDMSPAFESLRNSSRHDAQVFLVNKRGDYLAHTDRRREFRFEFGDPRRWHDDVPELAEQFSGDKSIAGVFRNRDGRRLFAAAAPVRLVDQRELVVVEMVPYSQLTAAAATVRNSVAIAGLCSAVMAALLAVVFARRTARPIERLAASVAAFTGKESVIVPVSSHREVRDLSTAVETMTQEVRRQIDSLRRQTLESAPIAIVMIDDTGTIVIANSIASAMFNYAEGELIGQPVELLVPVNIAEAHVALRDAYLRDPQQRVMGEGRELFGRRKEGNKFPVEVGLNPVELEDGVCVLAVIADITERRRLEDHQRRAKEMLERRVNERTEELRTAVEALECSNLELQQFAFVASHDLQSPLRGISGFVQLLQKRYGNELNDEARSWIDRTVEATQKMQTLINDLLAYSRVESRSRPFEPIDLRVVFDDVTTSLAPSIDDSGAQLTRDELAIVSGDRSHLVQLLQNLIGNAIKYRGTATPAIHVSAERRGDEWVFSVSDNGIGIDKKHHERIFEIFRRLHTEKEIPGTGIGLAICRRVVIRHGGRIWIESEPGNGTTVRFTIAATGASQHEPAKASSAD